MFDDSQKITVVKLFVEVELDDGNTLTGSMFLKPQGRLTDMLNDERMFLPFETTGGKFMIIRKSSFRSVAPLASEGQVYEGNNPFQILGVREGAPLDEIKEAYRTLCAENHPDRLNGTGLSQDYIELANQRMARINDVILRRPGL